LAAAATLALPNVLGSPAQAIGVAADPLQLRARPNPVLAQSPSWQDCYRAADAVDSGTFIREVGFARRWQWRLPFD
jgi:hypothetical protein